jgi:hypothetical protein
VAQAAAPPAPGAVEAIPPSAAVTIDVAATPIDKAHAALSSGAPDQAIALLRPVVARGDRSARPVLAEALVDSGWKALNGNRREAAVRRAREALAVAGPGLGEGRGAAHALMGEALFAGRDFGGALDHFSKALAESPGDTRLKRRVIRTRRVMRRPGTDGRPGEGDAAGAPAAVLEGPAPADKKQEDKVDEKSGERAGDKQDKQVKPDKQSEKQTAAESREAPSLPPAAPAAPSPGGGGPTSPPSESAPEE